MSRLSTKQRRACRRRRRHQAILAWVNATSRVMVAALCTPTRPWFRLTYTGKP